MTNLCKYIWMDGELVEYEKATVPFLNNALHYGTAVFEGIRAYATDKGPAIFRLKEHMDRLINSARIKRFSATCLSPPMNCARQRLKPWLQ